MYRFFVSSEQLKEEVIALGGEDYNHIRNVLRMKVGEEVLLCDSGEKEYLSSITGYDTDRECVLLKITDVFGNARELSAKLTLFQGYPKGDKLDTIIQKAVELGVYEVVPVMMKRCVVKLDEKKAAKKVERFNAISLSAAKQSKRGRIPEVREVMNLTTALEYAKKMDMIILPYENAKGMEYAKQVIKDSVGREHIGVFIGPEGGFELSEVQQIEEIGGRIISLGHRILRTETAGMTILSLLMFQLEQDEEENKKTI